MTEKIKMKKYIIHLDIEAVIPWNSSLYSF